MRVRASVNFCKLLSTWKPVINQTLTQTPHRTDSQKKKNNDLHVLPHLTFPSRQISCHYNNNVSSNLSIANQFHPLYFHSNYTSTSRSFTTHHSSHIGHSFSTSHSLRRSSGTCLHHDTLLLRPHRHSIVWYNIDRFLLPCIGIDRILGAMWRCHHPCQAAKRATHKRTRSGRESQQQPS